MVGSTSSPIDHPKSNLWIVELVQPSILRLNSFLGWCASWIGRWQDLFPWETCILHVISGKSLHILLPKQCTFLKESPKVYSRSQDHYLTTYVIIISNSSQHKIHVQHHLLNTCLSHLINTHFHQHNKPYRHFTMHVNHPNMWAFYHRFRKLTIWMQGWM